MTTWQSRVGHHWPTLAAARVIMVVTVGMGVAVVSLALDWRLVIPVGLGLPVAALGVLAQVAPDDQRRAASMAVPRGWTTVVHRRTWLAGTWAAMYLLTSLRMFDGERSVHAAAAGIGSTDIVLELLAFGCAGITVASVAWHGWPPLIPWLARLPLAFAALALSSVAWSRLPLFSLVRAGQLVVLALLTAYSAQRAATEPGWIAPLLTTILRLIVLGTLVLGLSGIADGALGFSRFTWRGSHPNTTAALLSAAALALLLHPARRRLTSPLPWWGVLGVLAFLAAQTGSRANVGAALSAFVVAGAVWTLRDSRVGALGFGAGVVAVGLTAQFAWEHVLGFVMRGQETDTVLGLNGRTELWEWVLDNPTGSELFGVGIGAARGHLPASWAGNAHSAWIDLLQGLGVLGLAAMGSLVVACLIAALLQRSPTAAWMFTLPAVASITAPVLSEPGWGIVLLCLGIVVIAGISAHDEDVT